MKHNLTFDLNIHKEDTYNFYNFTVFEDGEEVGVAIVMANGDDDDHAYIERLDVEPEKQNQGIGTDIMEMISDRWYGFEIAPDNEDAQRLYCRLGEESDWDEAWAVDQGFGVYRVRI